MHAVVIGAGLLGVTSAYCLRRQGFEVTVVERRDGAGLETSYANGALLHASLVDPWNDPGVLWNIIKWLGRSDAPMLLRPRALPSLIGWGIRFIRESRPERHRANTLSNLRLAQYSLEIMAELRGDTGLDYGYVPSGLLMVYRSDAALAKGRQMADQLSAHGVASEILDRDGVVACEPALARAATGLAGGIRYRRDERGDARRFCEALTEIGRQRGIDYRFGETVATIECRDGRFSAVRTDHGIYSADCCVVAAGSYSTPLLRPLGLRIPVRPAKGYSLTAHRASAQMPRIPVVDHDRHAAVVPVGDDKLRTVGTAELAGFDTTIDPARIANLKSLMRALYPDYTAEVADNDFEPWAGLRPMSPDGVPLIGATPIGGLYLNTGHGHLGWTLAAGSATLLANVVADTEPEISPTLYAPSRFPALSSR